MIVLEAVRLKDYMLYGSTSLPLASGRAGAPPITAIRGYNEHGKTSLFRSLQWLAFGEKTLPDPKDVRPRSADGVVETRGELEFSIHQPNGMVVHYRIVRVLITDDDGIIGSREHLEQLDGSSWIVEADDRLREIKRQHFPPELHDLLFMDKDKPEEFAGGDEARPDRNAMRRSVTTAIDQLLGLEVLKKVAEKTKAARGQLADRLSGVFDTAEHDALRKAAEDAATALEGARTKVDELRPTLAELQGELEDRQAEREEAADDLKELDGIRSRLSEARAEETDLKAKKAEWQRQLSTSLLHEGAWAGCFSDVVVPVLSALKEQHRQGVIPRAQLPLLRNLLDPASNPDQKCICGETRLSGDVRARLEALVERNTRAAGSSELLERFRADLQRSAEQALGRHEDWRTDFTTAMTNYQEVVVALNHAQEKVRELRGEEKEAIEGGGHMNISSLDQLIGSLGTQIEQKRRQLADVISHIDGTPDSEGRVPASKETLPSRKLAADRRLSNFEKRKTEARIDVYARDAADALGLCFAEAATAIRTRQVPMVSATMADLFAEITNNYADVGELPEAEPTGRTARVGIRAVPNTATFELFAEDDRGRDKPLHQLNGASRRALALSFLLALFEHSGTSVPLVADSLLHSLAGTVKSRLIGRIAKQTHQCILMYTHDDALNEDARRELQDASSVTYTLTNQARPQELVNRTQPLLARDSLITVCDCGPAYVCDVCDMRDSRDIGRLEKRDSKVLN